MEKSSLEPWSLDTQVLCDISEKVKHALAWITEHDTATEYSEVSLALKEPNQLLSENTKWHNGIIMQQLHSNACGAGS